MWHVILTCYMVFAMQPSALHQSVVSHYIAQGLAGNLALQQHTCTSLQALAGLRRAKAALLPALRLEARYTRAGGGRTIDLPIGDLMNPVHEALNDLLQAQGQPGLFPGNIQNERIYFLRSREHDTKLNLSMPIYYPELRCLVKAHAERARMAELARRSFCCQLVADIQTAYYTVQKALYLRDFLLNNRELLQENLRVCRSLYTHHKRTQEIVFQAQAELTDLEAHIVETDNDLLRAKAYFNFLLNRPLEAEITGSPLYMPTQQDLDVPTLQQSALRERLDFLRLNAGIRAAEWQRKAKHKALFPQIVSSVAYGFQGEEYRFSAQDDYWSASLVLRWDLYTGGGKRATEAQARWQLAQLRAQADELAGVIRLQVQTACQDMQVALLKLKTCLARSKSRGEAFRIVEKKFSLGLGPHIEYVEARKNYTNAGIARILALFDVYIKRVELTRAARLDGDRWLQLLPPAGRRAQANTRTTHHKTHMGKGVVQ